MTTTKPATRTLSTKPALSFKPPPSVLGRGTLGTSLLLVLPLFFVYELGLLISPFGYNGVDIVTRQLIELVDGSRTKFLLLNLVLAAVLGLVIYRHRERITVRLAVLTITESVVWAAAMVGLAWLTLRLFGIDAGGGGGGWFHLHLSDVVVASAGAGFHEEMVFRLGVMCGGAWLIRACGIRHGAAVLFALLGSAVIFAAAHHVGPGGEPFRWVAFVDRSAAGLLLGLVAYHRSLAHAVYAHFLYDVFALSMM